MNICVSKSTCIITIKRLLLIAIIGITFNTHALLYILPEPSYLHGCCLSECQFVGRNCNTCFYAIKSHDQRYYITLCILINVIKTLELKPMTINSTHHYIKRQYSERQDQQIFRVPEVFICYMYMCGRDLPNMSSLTLRHCTPLGSRIHIRQISPVHVTYTTCILIVVYQYIVAVAQLYYQVR